MRYRLLIAAGLLCALTARAGVLIVEKTEHFGRAGLSSTSRVHLDRDRVRVESTGSQNESLFIYLASTETMYIINPKEGSYMELTRAQIEAMMNQVAQMKAMMDEKLKGLPPEQRRMMEKMMKGRMGAAQGPPVKTVYRKVGSGETVGQWSCDKYEGYRQNDKVSEIWTADWSDFGIKPEDFAVFRSLAKMFEGLAKQMKIDMYQVGAVTPRSENEFAGLPVRRISYRNGKPYAKHEVLEVTRMDFDDSLFQVPAGLKKKEMPNMGKLPQAKSQPRPSTGKTAATSPARTQPPAQPATTTGAGQGDCFAVIGQYRAGQSDAAAVHSACPPNLANSVVPPPSGAGAEPPAPAAGNDSAEVDYDPYFSDEPVVYQQGRPVRLAAKRVVKTAVQTAASTATQALADYAVRKVIHKGIEHAAGDAAARGAGGAFGALGSQAASGMLGFRRGRTKPGYEFVVMETAKSAAYAAAGEAIFLIPGNQQSVRLVKAAAYDGFRVLASRRGRVTGDGRLKKADGPAVAEEIGLRLLRTTARGAVYQAAGGLAPGAQYALYTAGSNQAYDFAVSQ